MAFSLPPWLQIAPEQFTKAAVEGAAIGTRAGSEVNDMVANIASRAAELEQRRNEVASRLAVQQQENQIRQQIAQQEMASQQEMAAAEQAAQAQQQQFANDLALRESARRDTGVEQDASKLDIERQKLSRPDTFVPSELGKLIAEQKRYAEGGDAETADIYSAWIDRRTQGKLPPEVDFQAQLIENQIKAGDTAAMNRNMGKAQREGWPAEKQRLLDDWRKLLGEQAAPKTGRTNKVSILSLKPAQ